MQPLIRPSRCTRGRLTRFLHNYRSGPISLLLCCYTIATKFLLYTSHFAYHTSHLTTSHYSCTALTSSNRIHYVTLYFTKHTSEIKENKYPANVHTIYLETILHFKCSIQRSTCIETRASCFCSSLNHRFTLRTFSRNSAISAAPLFLSPMCVLPATWPSYSSCAKFLCVFRALSQLLILPSILKAICKAGTHAHCRIPIIIHNYYKPFQKRHSSNYFELLLGNRNNLIAPHSIVSENGMSFLSE